MLAATSKWRTGQGICGLDEDERDEEVVGVTMYRDSGNVVVTIEQGGKRGRRFQLMVPPEAIVLLYTEWFEKHRPGWKELVEKDREISRLQEANRKLDEELEAHMTDEEIEARHSALIDRAIRAGRLRAGLPGLVGDAEEG